MRSEFVDREKLEALADDEYPVEHSGFTAPPPERCGCDECYVRSMERLAFLAGAAAYSALLDTETTEEWQHYKPARGGYKNAYPGRKEGNVKPEYLDEWKEERRRVLYGPWLPSEGGEKP